MDSKEQNALRPAARTGPLATLRTAILRMAVPSTAASLALLFIVPVAAAACEPATLTPMSILGIHATRANLGSTLAGSPSAMQYRFEYATSEATLREGKGSIGSSGTTLGTIVADLSHLTPGTHYYARVIAENTCGSDEKTATFTTNTLEPPEINVGGGGSVGATTATFDRVEIQTNGTTTEYHVEYTTEPADPFSWLPSSGATGSVTAAEDSADREAGLTGLTPETTYFIRATAKNAIGEAAKQQFSVTTEPAHPSGVNVIRLFDVTGDSGFVLGDFRPHDTEAHWRFEYATSENAATWTNGPEGTVSTAEAETGEGGYSHVGPVEISGLSPSTTYYVRLFVENADGSATSLPPQSFTTVGGPSATTFPVHAFAPGSETVRALGSAAQNTEPVSELQTIALGGVPTGGSFTLSFAGQATSPLPFDATRDEVQSALEALPAIGAGNVHVVSEERHSPFAIEFINGESKPDSLSGKDQPEITADASGLTPSGTVTTATLQNGFSFDTSDHFEYVSQRQFAVDGWAEAQSTVARDLGGGKIGSQFGQSRGSLTSGADLPGLQPGETYHYRVVAENNTPGDPVAHGADETLTAPGDTPSSSSGGGEAGCRNERLRTGPSGRLPDCRVYELVTPANKQGSMDTFTYDSNLRSGALVGEDGEHVLVSPVGAKWGANVDPTDTSYFFSREPDVGWQMTSATPQPLAGANSYSPELFNPDLTQTALSVGWSTGFLNFSKDLEFETGASGGPYTTVASISRKRGGHWVAASADFSKLILQTEDRTLVPGHPSSTTSGDDFYEYSAGELRQVNVGPGGVPTGTCGATIDRADPHAVSADGSRVLFTDNCTHHLYMRINGVETLDIGEYQLLAADATDSRLLLARGSGPSEEVFLYETEAQIAKLLPGARAGQVSEDLSTIYISSSERLAPEASVPSTESEASAPNPVNIYRYDVSTGSLRFTGIQTGSVVRTGPDYVSPEGRYLYFFSPGVSGLFREREHVLHEREGLPPATAYSEDVQLYRYDSAEDVVECASCASSFAPRPASLAYAELNVLNRPGVSIPRQAYASADGDYAFFQTAAALVPSDADGEVPVGPVGEYNGEGDGPGNHNLEASISTDVYEWRKQGIGGCAAVQGCLALISSGTGGLKNTLVGIANEGSDVFFATHSQLVPQDKDEQGDVYDARLGGGFPPPPPRPVECEGDSCSTPFAAPSDPTPSSSTFQGAGNLLTATLPEIKPTPKSKAKSKCRSKAKKRCRRRSGRKARHAARHVGGTGKAGR
jgi:hypothetical protein